MILTRKVAEVLQTRVVALSRRRRSWTLSAESSSQGPSFPLSLSIPLLDGFRNSPDTVAVDRLLHDDDVWTLVWSGGPPAAALAVYGDWTSSAATLVAFAQSASLGLWASIGAAGARQRLAVHRMSRLLARASGMPAVGDLILQHMVDAVGARIGALAVPDETGARLSIVAAHGYRLGLVEHLRIEPGMGVLGKVFETGRTLHITPANWKALERPRRPRYRTDSFAAVPILRGREVLGIVSVTDRLDDAPFTRAQVSALRALAAPAALALERERATKSAAAYALAAAIDPVSGVFNRRYFHARLEEELQRSRRHDMPVALLMIDIDDFKAINDTFGHLAGDTVLKDVAEILRRSIRVFDVCARFGGEEFAIIMPGSGSDSAQKIAERTRERIESYRPLDGGLASVRITVSVGLAVSSMTMSGRDLIERADHALYRAKRAGKNRVLVVPANEELPPLVPGK